MRNNIEEFYKSFGFIVAFLVLTLFIQMTFNSKIANGFLTLVLLSMITVNSDKFNTMLTKIFKKK